VCAQAFAQTGSQKEVEALFAPWMKVRETYKSIEYSGDVQVDTRAMLRPKTLPASHRVTFQDLHIVRLDAPEVSTWRFRHGLRGSREYIITEPLEIVGGDAEMRNFALPRTFRNGEGITEVFLPRQKQVIRELQPPAEQTHGNRPIEIGLVTSYLLDYYGPAGFEMSTGLPSEEWSAIRAAGEYQRLITRTGARTRIHWKAESPVRKLNAARSIEFDDNVAGLPVQIEDFRDGRPISKIELEWTEWKPGVWVMSRVVVTRFESFNVDNSIPGAISDVTTTLIPLESIRDDASAFEDAFNAAIPTEGVAVTEVDHAKRRAERATRSVPPPPSTEVTRTMQWMLLAAVLAALLTIAILAIVLGKRKAKTGS
jgi:hypothetical protein